MKHNDYEEIEWRKHLTCVCVFQVYWGQERPSNCCVQHSVQGWRRCHHRESVHAGSLILSHFFGIVGSQVQSRPFLFWLAIQLFLYANNVETHVLWVFCNQVILCHGSLFKPRHQPTLSFLYLFTEWNAIIYSDFKAYDSTF